MSPITSEQQFGDLIVVIVDDNKDVRSALGGYFSSSGAIVRVCQDAEEALAVIPRVRPDLVVSDLGMPGKDGFALLREIRALDPSSGGGVPVIALSEMGSGDSGLKLREAGFAAVLRKPFTPRDLIQVIAELGLWKFAKIPRQTATKNIAL